MKTMEFFHMITNTGLHSAPLVFPSGNGVLPSSTSPIRGHFDQVLSRIQAQPLRILPRAGSGGSTGSLAQQMQREGII